MALIGALQGTIVICGALLRPIVIQPKTRQETDGSSTQNAQSTNGDVEHATKNDLIVDETNKQDFVRNADVRDEVNSELEGKTLLTKEVAELPPGVKNDEKPVKKFKLLDFSILKECSFILYSLFGLFATLGFFAPQLYIIELSVSCGVERDRATYMLSTMAVAEIVGRFFIGWLLTQNRIQKRKLLVLMACVISMTADLLGFTLVTEFYGLVVCCAVYGFFMGTLACTHIPMLAEDDVVGLERMSSAAGVYVFIHSFAGLAGPPLGGKRHCESFFFFSSGLGRSSY